jgi:glycerol kinase
MSCYLAIDQGTHASRALVFDADGNVIARSVVEVSLKRLDAAHVEQSAAELSASIHTVVQDVLAQCRGKEITACGLATQRSTVVGWHADGSAASAALSWQDVRGNAALAPLATHAGDIQRLSGLPLSPHYGASKLRWLMQQPNSTDADRYSPLVSYLLFHLLADKPYLVDHCNAQRTQLFALEQLDWSLQLCDWFGINIKSLPTCKPVCHDYGVLNNTSIPVTAVSGDQNAALYGDGALTQGTARINLGSGAFVMHALEYYRASDTQLTGIALSSEDSVVWMREATINGAGSALAWAEDHFNITNTRECIADWLAQIKSPPIFINSVAGLGSPWWCSDIEPHFIDRDLSAAQRIAAVVESIVFMIQANLEIMRTESTLVRLRVSGGLSNIDGLCQTLANLSGLLVERGVEDEATARGIAWLAAGQPSHWRSRTVFDVFKPQYDASLQSRYDSAMAVLQKLIRTQEQ